MSTQISITTPTDTTQTLLVADSLSVFETLTGEGVDFELSNVTINGLPVSADEAKKLNFDDGDTVTYTAKKTKNG